VFGLASAWFRPDSGLIPALAAPGFDARQQRRRTAFDD
jgi:hypothetical protein